ncbi:MAG: hypothetical protein CHACPFDD_03476 [Phycisphaerae bacterium]|nr:hypothetical protein [Phycisphaerae bacterium]
MKLPRLDDPPRFQGLYVFDFGEWCAVGYTAEEIATLLESEQFRGGKVYRIQRAWPDGRMELRGVTPDRFQLESGMFFGRAGQSDALRDFHELAALADRLPPPCRARVQVAELESAACRFVTALLYPAEYDDDVGAWLTRGGFNGGDTAEGGISLVGAFEAAAKTMLDRRQLWPAGAAARSREELFASVRRALQR